MQGTAETNFPVKISLFCTSVQLWLSARYNCFKELFQFPSQNTPFFCTFRCSQLQDTTASRNCFNFPVNTLFSACSVVWSMPATTASRTVTHSATVFYSLPSFRSPRPRHVDAPSERHVCVFLPRQATNWPGQNVQSQHCLSFYLRLSQRQMKNTPRDTFLSS